jgi:glutamate synthase (ferredoxin)
MQPMRLLGHNGEINTLLGNINWAKSRGGGMSTDPGSSRPVAPLVDITKSDSANLDRYVIHF